MSDIKGRRMRVTRLDPDGRPVGESLDSARPTRTVFPNPLSHGITTRYHSGMPGKNVHTHSIEEMRVEALKIYDAQLGKLMAAGCVECGDVVAAIAYPPDWEAQIISNGRYPGVEATRAIEVRVRIRMLCARHAQTGALW